MGDLDGFQLKTFQKFEIWNLLHFTPRSFYPIESFSLEGLEHGFGVSLKPDQRGKKDP